MAAVQVMRGMADMQNVHEDLGEAESQESVVDLCDDFSDASDAAPPNAPASPPAAAAASSPPAAAAAAVTGGGRGKGGGEEDEDLKEVERPMKKALKVSSVDKVRRVPGEKPSAASRARSRAGGVGASPSGRKRRRSAAEGGEGQEGGCLDRPPSTPKRRAPPAEDRGGARPSSIAGAGAGGGAAAAGGAAGAEMQQQQQQQQLVIPQQLMDRLEMAVVKKASRTLRNVNVLRLTRLCKHALRRRGPDLSRLLTGDGGGGIGGTGSGDALPPGWVATKDALVTEVVGKASNILASAPDDAEGVGGGLRRGGGGGRGAVGPVAVREGGRTGEGLHPRQRAMHVVAKAGSRVAAAREEGRGAARAAGAAGAAGAPVAGGGGGGGVAVGGGGGRGAAAGAARGAPAASRATVVPDEDEGGAALAALFAEDVDDDEVQVAGEHKSEKVSPLLKVLEVFPDAEHAFVRDKLQASRDNVQAVIQLLASASYPKAKEPDRPGEGKESLLKKDFKSDAWETPPGYRRIALQWLANEFSGLNKKSIEKCFIKHKHHYFHTYKFIKSARDGDIATQVTRLAAAGLRTITAKRKPVPVNLGRGGGLGEDGALLQAELKFLQADMKKRQCDEDEQVARRLNEEIAEETGATMECGCCYGDFPFEAMVQCTDGHLFCDTCLKRTVEEALFGNQRAQVGCMSGEGCEASFTDDFLKKALSEQVYQKLQEASAAKAISEANIEGLEECPHCQYKAMLDEGDKIFSCPPPSEGGCGRDSCRGCKGEPHLPLSCDEVEKKAEEKGRVTMEEAMAEARMRRCPSQRCQKPFLKDAGCNKMTCPACGTLSCYVCRVEIPKKVGYKHFCQTPHCDHSRCGKCKLFSNTDEDDKRACHEAAERVKAQAARDGLDVSKVKISDLVDDDLGRGMDAHGRPVHARVYRGHPMEGDRHPAVRAMAAAAGDAARHLQAEIQRMQAAFAARGGGRRRAGVPAAAHRAAERAAALAAALHARRERGRGGGAAGAAGGAAAGGGAAGAHAYGGGEPYAAARRGNPPPLPPVPHLAHPYDFDLPFARGRGAGERPPPPPAPRPPPAAAAAPHAARPAQAFAHFPGPPPPHRPAALLVPAANFPPGHAFRLGGMPPPPPPDEPL